MYKNLFSIEKYLNLTSLLESELCSYYDKFEKLRSPRQITIKNAIKLLACDKH